MGNREDYNLYIYTKFIYVPIVIIQFILSCFADKIPQTCKPTNEKVSFIIHPYYNQSTFNFIDQRGAGE